MGEKHVFRGYLGNGFVKSGDFLAWYCLWAENLSGPRIEGIGVWEVGEKRGSSGKIGSECVDSVGLCSKNCVLHVRVVMGVARGTGLHEAGVWLGLL